MTRLAVRHYVGIPNPMSVNPVSPQSKYRVSAVERGLQRPSHSRVAAVIVNTYCTRVYARFGQAICMLYNIPTIHSIGYRLKKGYHEMYLHLGGPGREI